MRTFVMVLLSLISTGASANYSEMHDKQGYFVGDANVIISNTLSETQALLMQARFNLQRDLIRNDRFTIDSFFGKDDFEEKRDVVIVRLEKSIAMLEGLNEHSFKSAQWARHHHPSENFKNTSFNDSEKIFALVNWFGEHVNNNDEFIDDRHIYLGQLFFDKPNERSITLAHEISHLVGYEPEELALDPGKLRIYNKVPTMDYVVKPGAPNAIGDSYVWEDFLIYYAGKQNGILNLIREQFAQR